MIKPMDMEYIYIQMGQNIQGIGKTIYKTVKELKYGLMNLNMKDII